MFELIEIKLTRVRRMAEQADDTLLTYLIDMAIVQANKKIRSAENSLDALTSQEPRALHRDRPEHHLPQKFTVVRQALTAPSPGPPRSPRAPVRPFDPPCG